MAEKYLDEIILREKRRRIEIVLDGNVDLERDLPEGYLQTMAIGDEEITIKIPAFMKVMPKEWIAEKYQYDPVPQIVMTNQSGTVNFTFSQVEHSIPPEELSGFCKKCKQGMCTIMPGLVYFEEGYEEINGIPVCWSEYMNNAAGGKVYNLVFYAAADKVLVGTLNCPYKIHELWVRIGKLCMRTLRGR